MKKAFITTVYNEEKTIALLLDSLLKQNEIPNEIILVDAFSKDKTFQILSDFKKKYPKLIKVFRKKGNRSEGRNFAIKNARSDIIAASDSGCILKKDWFNEITKPFKEKNIDVVAGFYKPITRNSFEKCLSVYTCVMEDKVTKDFLPSSRSIAFRKNAWKNVDGYPEQLDTCEDLVFAKKMKKEGMKFSVNKKAIVYWPQRKNILQAFRQFFSYAKGDGKALYIRRQTPFLFIRMIGGFLLLMLLFYSPSTQNKLIILVLMLLYSILSVLKNARYINHTKDVLNLILLQLSSDIAVFFGFIYGVFKRLG